MSLDIDLFMDIDVGAEELHRVYLYELNITHNLNKMAVACGLYDFMWDAEYTIGKEGTAQDLVKGLTAGVEDLKNNPDKYKKYNASNGWGVYEDLLRISEEFLDACKCYPKAKISVSR